MFFGLMLGTIGIDLQSGISRFAMGIPELQDGIDFLVIILGIYAVGEVFRNYASLDQVSQALSENFGRIWITRLEWRKIVVPILRSTPVGFLIGVLPGAGGTIAAMVAYTNEKQLSKHPEEFGKGVIEGVAAPEAANNAASVGALIPMLTMGIPGSGTTAVMLGALMMLGVKPGPLLFKTQPEIVWGVIASMYIGNVICAILNVPLAGILVRLLYIPKKVLMPIILGLGFIGAYTLNYSIVDFYLLVTAGVAGLLMSKLKMPTTPLILALILGNMIEQSFRQALTISKGSFVIFVGDPISVILLLLAIGSVLYALVSHRRLKKRIAA